MDNLDRLHEEQDRLIKNVFQEDKIVSQPVFEDFTNYIENSNIKAKKYTYTQRKIIFLLILLLILSVGFNIYLAIFKNDKIENSEKILDNSANSNTNIFKETENEFSNNTSVNKIANSINVENKENSSTVTATVITSKEDSSDYSDINLDEISTLIENYSVGINRIVADPNNLESNTILLFIAKDYFDNKPSNSSLTIDTTFAATAENIHKYLGELTGNDYSNTEYIKSFNNYIGYVSSSKSYTFGPDSSIITREKYSCSDVKIKEKINDVYTVTANVTRTIDEQETNYEVELKIKINDDYTYQKYNIKELKAKNASFYPDNTVRLIDQNDVVVEDEDKK